MQKHISGAVGFKETTCRCCIKKSFAAPQGMCHLLDPCFGQATMINTCIITCKLDTETFQPCFSISCRGLGKGHCQHPLCHFQSTPEDQYHHQQREQAPQLLESFQELSLRVASQTFSSALPSCAEHQHRFFVRSCRLLATLCAKESRHFHAWAVLLTPETYKLFTD